MDMCVWNYACIHVYIFACMYLCINGGMYVYVRVYVYACMYLCMCLQCMCVAIRVRIMHINLSLRESICQSDVISYGLPFQHTIFRLRAKLRPSSPMPRWLTSNAKDNLLVKPPCLSHGIEQNVLLIAQVL